MTDRTRADFAALAALWPNDRTSDDDLAAYVAMRQRGYCADTLLGAVRRFSAWCDSKGQRPSMRLSSFLAIKNGKPNGFICREAQERAKTLRASAEAAQEARTGRRPVARPEGGREWTVSDLTMTYDEGERAWDVSTPGGWVRRMWPSGSLARPDADRDALVAEFLSGPGEDGAWRTWRAATAEDVSFTWRPYLADHPEGDGCWHATATNGFETSLGAGIVGHRRPSTTEELLAEFNLRAHDRWAAYGRAA